MGDNRYARQILAFGEEGQRKIEATEVAIVGLGGLGSHIAQGLAYLGVGSFVLVDDDYVDLTNLNRLVGGIPEDAVYRRKKVDVADRLIRQVSPKANVKALPANLRSHEAISALTACPVIFGCVDHDAPRLILMELAAAYGRTLIDSATEILVEDEGIREFGGRVVVARPGDFCLDCAGQIDMETAKQELETPTTRELRKAFGYGLGEQGKAPAVVSLNGAVANLAVTEFLMMTTGIREPFRHLTYYGLRSKVNVRDDRRRPTCFVCGYLAGLGSGADLFRYASEGALHV